MSIHESVTDGGQALVLDFSAYALDEVAEIATSFGITPDQARIFESQEANLRAKNIGDAALNLWLAKDDPEARYGAAMEFMAAFDSMGQRHVLLDELLEIADPDVLRRKRESLGIKLKDVADIVGIDPAEATRQEKGDRDRPDLRKEMMKVVLGIERDKLKDS